MTPPVVGPTSIMLSKVLNLAMGMVRSHLRREAPDAHMMEH